jgi:hypothetical protein
VILRERSPAATAFVLSRVAKLSFERTTIAILP